jgi:hypothetical protein
MTVDEVIIILKGKLSFGSTFKKNIKIFGIKIYKLCDRYGYTCDMRVFLGKQRNMAS